MIHIGEFRIIKKDALNWSIEQSYLNKDEEILWKVLGWYPKIEMTIPRFIDILIANEYEDLNSIEELLEAIVDIKEVILEELDYIDFKEGKE